MTKTRMRRKKGCLKPDQGLDLDPGPSPDQNQDHALYPDRNQDQFLDQDLDPSLNQDPCLDQFLDPSLDLSPGQSLAQFPGLLAGVNPKANREANLRASQGARVGRLVLPDLNLGLKVLRGLEACLVRAADQGQGVPGRPAQDPGVHQRVVQPPINHEDVQCVQRI